MKIIKKIKSIFFVKKVAKYSGAADFFMNATEKEKKDIIKKAAYGANEMQLDLVKKAELMYKN